MVVKTTNMKLADNQRKVEKNYNIIGKCDWVNNKDEIATDKPVLNTMEAQWIT